jgi:hypothetical protein
VLEKQIGDLEADVSRMRHQEQERNSQFQHLVSVWTETDSLIRSHSDSPRPKSQTSPPVLLNESDLIAAIQDHRLSLQNVLQENSSLKSELSSLVQENMRMQSVIKERSESEKSKLIEAQLREELRDEKERVSGLMDEMDVLKERLRCAEVVANELKKQVKEMTAAPSSTTTTSASSAAAIGPVAAGSSASAASSSGHPAAAAVSHNNPVVLRQELKSVREVVAAREAMIKSLNDKYIRHRQVWEENERRANEEIKKLDEIIDRVVLTLQQPECRAFVSSCSDLKRLFEDLTRDQQISVTTLSHSTIV